MSGLNFKGRWAWCCPTAVLRTRIRAIWVYIFWRSGGHLIQSTAMCYKSLCWFKFWMADRLEGNEFEYRLLYFHRNQGDLTRSILTFRRPPHSDHISELPDVTSHVSSLGDRWFYLQSRFFNTMLDLHRYSSGNSGNSTHIFNTCWEAVVTIRSVHSVVHGWFLYILVDVHAPPPNSGKGFI